MKLYISEILKEANALGFGAPGQGGNSNDVSFQQAPSTPAAMPPPTMQPNNQLGGMMLPSNPGGMPNIPIQGNSLKPGII